MGGAERTARKRRQEQQARNAVAQARGGGNGKRIALIIGVLVLVAAVIIGGVLWTNASQNETEGQQIPAAEPVRSEHPETRDGVVVETGSPDAGATIDVYVDFLCPACGQFHETFGQQINQKVADGSLRVRTHMVPMLTEQSSPPGYSLDAANAALLAADEGRFTRFHDSLFESQPAERPRLRRRPAHPARPRHRHRERGIRRGHPGRHLRPAAAGRVRGDRERPQPAPGGSAGHGLQHADRDPQRPGRRARRELARPGHLRRGQLTLFSPPVLAGCSTLCCAGNR
ncbi:thioredoxin domain-containing protein [Saccharomonospora sp. CUA-673]|uniref:thioredoxin domain-containing protein n=1 Tax=Saccharomonospora sp. CUA-673 TaxID=1904969 RepID=UPI003516C926